MKLNDAGIALIKSFESCSAIAYPDPGTGGEPYTIGYGHTEGVKPGEFWSQEHAEEILKQDLASFCARVRGLLDGVELNDNKFSALVSFAFNCGIHNLASSTLLKKVMSCEYQEAANEFLKWNKANGKPLSGLLRRRSAERELFLQA